MAFDLNAVGKILKDKRIEEGLTLEDISKLLNLRKTLIDGIERAHWKILPHEVYVKGYVKQYANHLNIIDTVLPYLNVQQPNDIYEETIETAKTSPEDKRSITSYHNQNPRRHVRTSFLLYAGICIILVFFLSYEIHQKHFSPVAGVSQHLQNSPVSVSTQSQEKPVVSELSPSKKLMITCHDRTWLSVVIDSNEKKEFTLNPDEVMILNAKERFDVLVGNAGGVKLFVNGKDTGFDGLPREVKKVSF